MKADAVADMYGSVAEESFKKKTVRTGNFSSPSVAVL